MTLAEYEAQRAITERLLAETRELHAWCRNTRNVAVLQRYLKARLKDLGLATSAPGESGEC